MIKIKQEIKFYGKIKKNIWWNKFKMIIFNILKPPVYSTDILADGEKYQFNDQYKVYLLNSKLGDLNIKYEQGIETWMVHAEFKHSGKTEFILESPSGEKRIFEITIKRDTYIINEKNT